MNALVMSRHIRADSRLQQHPGRCSHGHAIAGNRERFPAVGFKGHLLKPIGDEQVLLRTIEEGVAT